MNNVTIKKVVNLANNQVLIYLSNGKKIFNSYGVNVVEISENETKLDEKYWNYSNTTSKYRCKVLNELGNETQKKIKNGVYVLCNLNEG